MSIEDFLGVNGSVWILVKIFYLVLFSLYFIFTLIVWKQISLMAKTLNGSMDLPLRFIGMVVSVLALLGLVMALMIL